MNSEECISAEDIQHQLEEKGYDTVICTHLYGMEVMTAIKKRLKKYKSLQKKYNLPLKYY